METGMGNLKRRDWLDFADAEAVRAEYLAGPQDLSELSPGVWGHAHGHVAVCIGDRSKMRQVVEKMFNDRFHAKPCPMGYYGPDHGGPPLPSVAERIVR